MRLKRTIALLAAAEGADVLSTWYALAHGAHEGNPVAAMLGPVLFVALKFATVPLVAWLAATAPTPKGRRFVLGATRIGAYMLLGVAASNVLVALKCRSFMSFAKTATLKWNSSKKKKSSKG